jgi:hypothetical protein
LLERTRVKRAVIVMSPDPKEAHSSKNTAVRVYWPHSISDPAGSHSRSKPDKNTLNGQ